MFKKRNDNKATDETKTAAASVVAEAKPATAAEPKILDPEEAKKRAAASKRISASFGDIVLLMSRSPGEQHYGLRLPLPWIEEDPVSTRFSTFAASVWVTEARTVSVPSFLASTTVSLE